MTSFVPLTSDSATRARARAFAVAVVCTLAGLVLIPSGAAAFGLESIGGSLAEPDGQPVTQAGAHPDFTTTIKFDTKPVEGGIGPDGAVRGVKTTLPPGLLGNPRAFQRCTQGQLKGLTGESAECPVNSQVGVAELTYCLFGECLPVTEPIYNMSPPSDVAGQIAFNLLGVLVFINLQVHHQSGAGGGEYVVTTSTEEISQSLALTGIKITLWGVPGDPIHDPQRYYTSGELSGQTGASSSAGEVPLMRNPTSCSSQLSFGVQTESWAQPGVQTPLAMFDEEEGLGTPLQTSGCQLVSFSPTIAVQPTTTQAGAPTGLEVTLNVPQNENPRGLASADLRDAVVTLPTGMVVNPSAASGLGACGLAEINLAGENSQSCPSSSKIGEVMVHTPLLGEPLLGAIYQARQGENPFNSTLAIYLVASGSGVTIKIPGELEPDPVTGQLTARFSEAPQLPFSSMTLRFKGGSRALLSNPSSCGPKTASAQLSSWSGSSVSVSSDFTITGPCGQGAFAPSFEAGSAVSAAGSPTAFTLSFSRSEDEQVLGSADVQLPAGLLGYIKTVPLCPEPAAASGACGEESLIGHTTVAAGAGGSPFYLSGDVYLTGPYDGAPYGLSVVVPAVAGPLNLGLVVVRASINVDRNDAHVSIATSSFPTILQGIPLQLRMVDVTIDRPGFLFNPTSCAKRAVTGTLGGGEGASAAISAPFLLGGCSKLPFKAKLTALTEAKTSKRDGAYLHVKLVSGSGQANLGKVAVSLPEQLPSRLSTLQKACSEATFEANPGSCPAASVVGTATVTTPILHDPLTGPAYLVAHPAEIPGLEIVLQGEGITLILDGKTRIKKGITSSTFNAVPDAPISSFNLVLPEGPHSVFSANGSLCKGTLGMPTTLTGQNGAVLTQTTKIAVSGCPKRRVAKRGKK